jgi:isopentenyl-diphosphate delta-isomerase
MLPEYKVLLNELVAVTRMDQFIGSVDKWQAHTNKYITGGDSNPHRAFSIFLFNKENKLMFQRRSAEKKTFPLCWTNTCCSHPNMVMDEQTK